MNKPRLQEKFEKEITPAFIKEFSIGNKMAVPKVVKVVVNVGVGEIAKNKDTMELAKKDIAQITGQVPAVRAARVSIATFNLRRGMPVGLSVTLRGEKKYAFLDKLFSIVFPRFRDFRGVSAKSFDSRGNYTLGIEENTVFPELDLTKAHSLKGFEITIVTNCGDTVKAKRLLELMGMPFAKEDFAKGKPFEKGST